MENLYNPHLQNRDTLLKNFIVRQRELEILFSDIRSSKMETPEQHYLITGQRGAGKSTLVHALCYKIEDDTALNNWLIPIVLSEEQYNIYSIGDLWQTIVDYLEDYKGIADADNSENQKRKPDDKSDNLLEKLLRLLRTNNKKIILFIENIGVFFKKIDVFETKKLREVLMTIPEIRLIGTATDLLDETSNYEAAFFEFFKVIPLNPLTIDETKQLLRTLAEKHQKSELIERIIQQKTKRIDTLWRLTGGVTRTIVLLFNIFIDQEDNSLIKDFQSLLDAVTPLYKHRMDDLKPQQQKIVDAVAKNWDAISVSELVQRIGIESKQISAQLIQLEKNQIIEKIATKKKNHYYQIRERFFNIWYLMRYGRAHEKNRVIWLVRFFESWCDRMELNKRMNSLLLKIKHGDIDNETAFFFGQAYLQCKNAGTEERELLVKELVESIPEKNSDKHNYLVKEAENITAEKKRNEYIQARFELHSLADEIDAGMMSDSLLIDRLNALMRQPFKHIAYEAKIMLAYVYEKNYKYFDLAKQLYKETILERLPEFGNQGFSEHRLAHIEIIERANFLLAENYFLIAIEKGDKTALYCLINMHLSLSKEFGRAEDLFIKNKLGNTGTDHNLWAKIQDLKYNNTANAIHYFEKAIEAGHQNSIRDLAVMYHAKNDNIAAIKVLEKHKTKLDEEHTLLLGKLYRLENRADDGIKTLEQLDPIKHPEALHELAHLYAQKGEKERELKYLKQAVEGGDDTAIGCYAETLFERGEKKEEALALFQKLQKDGYKFKDEERFVHAIISLWNNEIELALSLIDPFFSDPEKADEFSTNLHDFFLLLLAKGQHYAAHNLFTKKHPILRDLQKPMYYAIMKILFDEHDDYLRMGSELKDTVKEILQEVERYKLKYNS